MVRLQNLPQQSRRCWQRRWTFVVIVILVVAVIKSRTQPSRHRRRPTSSKPRPTFAGWRLLYIVTSLAEYDNGKRKSVKGFDRFRETFVPVLRESVESMLSFGFEVDVFIVAHYKTTRSHLIREALPSSVGLQIWEDASPLGYRLDEKDQGSIGDITRALARQHRYVIKDKFEHYDFFCNFEDDMLIKGDAVANFIEMTNELYRLRDLAPEVKKNNNYMQEWDEFYGVLSKRQLSQMIPGFIRVESLLDHSLLQKKNWIPEGLVPITDRPDLDPEPCCWLSNPLSASRNRPTSPDSEQLYIWETNVRALGIRKMPLQSKFDWVLFQRGRRTMIPDREQANWVQIDVEIGDYWSGRDGYFEPGYGRPDTKQFVYLNNQGGWMATKKQLGEWHTDFCQGGFLPPYGAPHFNFDGLDLRNVEYWSGGLHLFTLEHGCNLQRIISLDPDRFARQLLWHTANNKQRHLNGARQIKFANVNDFLGQLNTLRKSAQAVMARRLETLRKQHN
jgi:hypothetical protein